MATRICSKCTVEKPLDQFYLRKKGRDKRSPSCKTCDTAKKKQIIAQRRAILGAAHPLLQRQPQPPRPQARKTLAQREQEAMLPRICTHCGIEKPASEFHWRYQESFQLQPYCKPCGIIMARHYRDKQREELGSDGLHLYHQARYKQSREQQLALKKAYYQKNKALLKERGRQHYIKNKSTIRVRRRAYTLRRHFGLTVDAYNAMLEQQGGVCAICQNGNGKRLFIDHCHTTGRVRGLLCAPCNSFLGRIKDSPEALARILAYLAPQS